MEIPTPKDHAAKFQTTAPDAHRLAELRTHVTANLNANGHADEHVIDVSRFDTAVIDAVAKECEARGWRVSRDVDKDESPKLVLRP